MATTVFDAGVEGNEAYAAVGASVPIEYFFILLAVTLLCLAYSVYSNRREKASRKREEEMKSFVSDKDAAVKAKEAAEKERDELIEAFTEATGLEATTAADAAKGLNRFADRVDAVLTAISYDPIKAVVDARMGDGKRVGLLLDILAHAKTDIMHLEGENTRLNADKMAAQQETVIEKGKVTILTDRITELEASNKKFIEDEGSKYDMIKEVSDKRNSAFMSTVTDDATTTLLTENAGLKGELKGRDKKVSDLQALARGNGGNSKGKKTEETTAAE